MLKKIIFINILLFAFNINNAQDIIILKTGYKIKAKIVSTTFNEIRYKKYSVLSGPTYIIQKKRVDMICYKNGVNEVFRKDFTIEQEKKLYSKKIHNYRITKYIGLGGSVLSVAYIYALTTNNSPINFDPFIQKAFSGYAFAGSFFLFISSIMTEKDYSEKLKNISLNINLTQKQKGVSLIYRF